MITPLLSGGPLSGSYLPHTEKMTESNFIYLCDDCLKDGKYTLADYSGPDPYQAELFGVDDDTPFVHLCDNHYADHLEDI